MLDKMRLPPGVDSIAKLENKIKLSPNLKDNWRIESFIVPGIKCPQCNHDVCEASASALSRDVIYISCLKCNHTW
jgi:Na+-translocating ferredoxin:NAD+ oxidoreductase RNF subunit RnfB